MKKTILLLMLFSSLILQAQDDYSINQKFVFHRLTFLETTTKKVLDSYDMQGVIIDCSVNGLDYLLISIPNVYTYNLRIVNKVEDYPEAGLKIVMYQGGEFVQDMGAYTANVFMDYDLKKNSITPEAVQLELDGSPNILRMTGIIRLTE